MHSLLQKAGADVGDVTEFNNWFFAKGDEGYKNRKSVFDTFKNAGADVGDTYEDFAGSLGLQAVKPGQTNLSRFDEESVNQTLDKAQQAISQAKQGANRILNREQRIGLDVPKGAFGRINLGENRKVTPGIDRFNFNKGQMEQTYITEAGNEYGNRGMADLEQNIVDDARRREQDPFGTQMGDAYSEQRNLQGRIEELEAKRNAALKEDNGFVYRDKNLFSDEEDQELQNLKAAQRQNDQRILTMEREKEDYEAHGVFETLGKWGSDFVKGMYDTARNPSVYSFGVTDLGDMTQLYKVKKKIEAANEAGVEPELTESEKSLLQNTMLNNYTQSEYGKNRSDMYDWGQIAMQAIPFVAEFWLTGGMKALSDLGAKYGTKAAAKMALDGWKAKVVKNTGVALGDLAAGFAMANTTGAAKTAAEILDRNIGDIDVDENGNYVFNNGESLAEAVYKGTLKQTFEYYTEKLGDHTNFSKYLAKGAEKFGLSKLSKAISFLSGSKGLKALGVHDYPSEVFEEEANLLLGATFGLDQNFSIAPLKAASNDIFGTTFQVDRNSKEYQESMFNGKTQKDIVFGMFFSLGVLNATRYAQTGYTAAQYKRFQHNVNNADAEASTIFGANNWQMIKEQIDACDNQDMAQLMQSVADGGMTTEQKAATAKYAANLMKMRGYNATLMSLLNVEEEKTSPKAQASNAVNKSYTEGYDAQEPTLRKQYNDEAIAAEQNLPQYGDEFAKMVSESETPVETLDYLMQNRDYYTDEQIGAAADYFTKKSRAEGMMDGALDQVDTQVEEAKANVRSNTHQQTGSVITAQYDGREYYVVGGDVVTDPETGTPMLAGTGGAVVVKDAETGETSVMNPNDLTMGAMQSADELIQGIDTNYRQQLMQQAEDDINYGAPANEVYQMEDTVALSDGEGGVIEGQIGMMPNSVDGVYVVYTPDGKALQMTADEMNRRIVAHNNVEVQRESPQQIENGTNSQLNGENLTENSENGQNYAQNQPENIQNQPEAELEEPQSALSRIPVKVDEKGNPFTNKKGKPVLDWHKASTEDAAAALIETTGGNMLMARDTASDLIKQGQAKLEKIRKQQPKGEDPIEIAESRMEIQRQVDEQQAINKQWQDVNQLIQRQMREEQQRIEAEREAAKSEEQKAREAEEKQKMEEQRRAIDEERRRKKVEDEIANWNKPYAPLAKARKELAGDPDALAILDDTEPRSLEEWISTLIRPKSMMWEDEEIGGRIVTGLQSELGLQKKDIERIGSLVAPSSKGGKPFGQVVHDIWEDLPEGMKQMYDDQAVRNALIGLFGSTDALTMRHLAEENRIAEARAMAAENDRRAAEAELEAWAEAMHLTPEERETYNEWMEQAPTEPEAEIINNIIADEQYRIYQREGRQPASRADVSGSTSSQEAVQQTAETADNGNNEKRIAKEGQAAQSEQTAADNNVPGAESEGVIPKPEVDEPRFKELRQNLVDAYTQLVNDEANYPDAAKKVSKAARQIQRYVDEGLDDYKEYEMGIEDYEGNDPEKLADQYITRVFQDRYADDDPDDLYIYHGLKPEMRKSFKFIDHKGKLFEANEHGICLNPNVIKMHKDKDVLTGWEISTALSERGWVGAPSAHYSTGGWSSGVSASWYDEFFATEEECQAYWAQRILDFFKKSDGKKDKKMAKYFPSLQELINKVGTGNEFKWGQHGEILNPHVIEFKKGKFSYRIETAEFNGKWLGALWTKNDPRYSDGGTIHNSDTHFFDSEQQAQAYYAQLIAERFRERETNLKGDLAKVLKSLDDIINKEPGLSNSQEWDDGASYTAPNGKKFLFNKDGVCTNPNPLQVGGTTFDVTMATAYNGVGWVGSVIVDRSLNFAPYKDVNKADTPVFHTEEECRAYLAGKAIDELKESWEGKQETLLIKALRKMQRQRADETEEEEEPVVVSQVNVEGLFNDLNTKGKTKLSDHRTPVKAKKRQPKDADFSGLNVGVRFNTPNGVIEITRVDYDRLLVKDVDKDGNTSSQTREIDTVDLADGIKAGTITKVKPAAEQPKAEHKRLVSDDRMEELKKQLKAKLGGQLNVGVDPEVLSLGAQLAVGYLERGVTKFADFAKAMIDEVGDFMRPYLKSFYNAVRDMPEAADYAADMDDYQTVSAFDVHNFDKGGKVPDAITKAQQVTNEQKVKKDVKKIKEKQPNLFAGDLFADQFAEPVATTPKVTTKKVEDVLPAISSNISQAEVEKAMKSNLVQSWLKGKGKDQAFNLFGIGIDLIRIMARTRLGITNKYQIGSMFNNAEELIEAHLDSASKKGLDDAIAKKYDFHDGDLIQKLIEDSTPLYTDEELSEIGKFLTPAGMKQFKEALQAFGEEKQIREEMERLKTYDNGNAVAKAFAMYDIATRRLREQYDGDERFFSTSTRVVSEDPTRNNVNITNNPDFKLKDGETTKTEKVMKSDVARQIAELIATAPISVEGLAQLGHTSSAEEIAAEEAKVDTNPTEAQKEAGNYQKGHIWVDGHDITIENPKGSIRRGTDANGKEWKTKMNNTYGYIRGTEGVDGDHIDVFLSDNPAWGGVYVVDQVNPDGSFDEHKVMYGFPNEEEARKAYFSNYSKGWKGLGTITEISREDFKKWIDSSHRKTKPFADYQIEANPWILATRAEDGTLMRRAIDKDVDTNNVQYYYNGKPAHIMLVTRKGEQVSATKFSEPTVESVTLTDGKRVKLNDLWVKVNPIVELNKSYKDNHVKDGRVEFLNVRTNANTGEKQYIGRTWDLGSATRIEFAITEKDLQANLDNGTYVYEPKAEPEKPKLDKKDYKSYMTPEAQAYFAEKYPRYAHTELAFIEGAVRDKVNIPVEELAKIPGIVEAEKRVKKAESREPLNLTDEEIEKHAKHLLDKKHGSAVFENGKIREVNGREDFSGPVKQERKAFVIIGRPAGGKSSVFANPLSNQHGARIIDSDVVKEWLDGFDGGYGAGYVQNMSSKIADRAMDIAVQNGDNIVLPRIGGESVVRMAAALRLMGYDVKLYYNDVVPETSYMRSQSRFAKTGRFLSLDYLTTIKDKPSKIFSKFAEKSIGDYLNECTEKEVQKLRGRLASLVGSQRSDILRAFDGWLEQRGQGNGDGGVPEDVERSGADGAARTIDPDSPLFTYAEWKSNDVSFGEKPKEIWNSNSKKSLSEVLNNDNNELHGVQSEQGLPGEPAEASEEAGQTGGAADRAGAERSPEQHRVKRSGHEHTIKNNNTRNNVGERGKDYAPTSTKARFNANVEAIKLMRQLIDNGVDVPTKEQMAVLRQYSGWGGMGTYFNDATTAEYRELMDLLSEEEMNDARLSINSAYYTPANVIDTLWDIAKEMGFKGGNVLEGSAGIGNIIGQMPTDMSRSSNIEAVEIDAISGNILKLLYPDAKVHIKGFQDVIIPNGSVDLAITNVPFVTGLQVFDKVDKDLSRKFRNIHDFCIAKNIRKLREGGIGLFITSSGTLDKSTELRAWIADEGQADVMGAFRMNNETFGGTTVTSDIIVVRKRTNGQKSPKAIDISTASPIRVGSYEDKYGDEHQTSMVVNDYFKIHPEMMAGEMAFAYEKGDTFRPGSYGLYPVKGMDQNKMLADFAKSMSSAKEIVAEPIEKKADPNQLTEVKEGRMLLDDNGRLCISRMGTAVPLQVNDQKIKGKYTKKECFEDYQSVQKAVDDVLQQQLNSPDDEALKPKLAALNKAYDNFVKKYGYLHKNTAIAFLRNDIDFPSFQALEQYNEKKDIKGNITVTTKKPPIFSERVLGFKSEPKPKNVKDAVTASIFRSNTIDLDWIAEKLDRDVDDVRKEILDSRLGFEDPSTGAIEIRYKYLSGNVREKLSIAEGYNTDGKYSANVEELRKAVPMDIPSHLIDFSLGSSWLPIELYNEFIKDTYDVPVTVKLIEGSWIMKENGYIRSEKNRAAGVYSEKFRETIYGHQLVNAALNNRPIRVSKQVKEGYGDHATTKTINDPAATQACAVRVDEIKEEFRQWMKQKMQSDVELSKRIEKIYNEKFNALVPMQIDDEFLPEHFEGSNVNITLRPHQKRGAIRDLTSPTMLAHEVGTGKSFTLITTAMEMRRLGTAKKPMLIVQNATVAQMTADAKLLYPNAKVLTLTEKDRNAEGRRAFYASIKYNDWDLIIIPQSTFERIPDSPERELQFIQEKIDEKKHVIEAAEAAGADSRQLRQLKNELEKIEQEYGDKFLDSDPANDGGSTKKRKKKDAKREATSLDKAKTKAKEQLDRAVDDVQYFDDLGVDALLVDEAHEYKHLGFQTSIGRGIKGIDPSYSKKCAGLYNKTRCVYEKAGWKNVVFATGTPISNTAAEIWTFMKYLMPADVMKQNDIYYFDDFVRNFGNISQMLEFTTSGKFKENTRFAAYVNRPELMRIWMQVADIVRSIDAKDVQDKLPKKEGGKDQDVFLPQSPSLINIMSAVRAELERFENMEGKEKKENSHIPLTMYGVAKRAAIDPRLVNPDAADEPLSKTNAAVAEIIKDLKATKAYNGTIAVFCDNQNRKGEGGVVEFNIYDDIKQKLIKGGVPEKQIAIIKSGMTIKAKQAVFDAVNNGDIRVVLGSTQTLGTGVNMQERLHLLIHMDAPDRPMDYTQRNGRIERQGNLHKDWDKPIRIVRFGVEDSLDVTAYQRLKTKSGFIDSIMNGKSALANNQVDRTVEEEEEGMFDNPVAVLSGSQYALLKNKAERELRKYQGKKSQWEADQIYITNALRQYNSINEDAEQKAQNEEKDLANIKSLFPDGKVKTISVEGTNIDMTKGDEAVGQLSKVIKEKINDPVNAIVKRNRENPFHDDETLRYKIKLDGHDVDFTIAVTRSNEWDNAANKMRTVIHKFTSYNSPDLRIKSDVSARSVKDLLDDILDEVVTGVDYQDRIDAIRAAIERRNSEMAQMKEREGKPFEYNKELEAARKQVDEYTDLMKKEMEEKEAKYANQQTGDVDLTKAEDSEDDNLYRMMDEYEPVYPNNLKSFFGDWEANPANASKIVDDNGLPLVVYRGGNKYDGTTIENASSNAMYGKAFYATPYVSGAEEYAEARTGNKNNVQAVYINVRNPFVDGWVDGFNHPEPASDEEIKNLLEALAKKGLKYPKEFLYKLNNGKIQGSILGHLANEEFEGIERPAGTFWHAADIVQETLKELGYDGVIGMYTGDVFRMPQVAAFDMSQVMKAEQPMFRDMDQFAEGQVFPIRKTAAHSSYNVLGQRYIYSTELLPDEYTSENAMLDALRNQFPSYYVTIEDNNVKMQSWHTVLAEAKQAQTMKQTKGAESYVRRKTRQAIDAINDMAKRMHLDVEVLTSTEGLTDKQKRAKGWFNPKTHKIVIVLDNHTNRFDLINTLLHEGVAHYGLRLMFGENFDTFLDNVYNNVDESIKEKINAAMRKNGWNRHVATEEYLASLAERTNFENAQESGWWKKIKDFFFEMLAKAGFSTYLSDNELRYILWRSYDNLLNPDSRRNIFDKAKEVQMQSQLRVGQYAERYKPTGLAAERKVSESVEKEYSTVEEASQIIRNLEKKYPPAVEVVVTNKKASGEDLLKAMIGEKKFEYLSTLKNGELVKRFAEEIREIINKQNNGKMAGGYIGVLKKIIIFADKIPTDRLEYSYFHENIHAILDSWYGNSEDGEKAYPRLIAENFWNNTPDWVYGYTKEEIEKYYKPDVRKEEFFTYCVSAAMDSGYLDAVEEYIIDEGDKQRFNNLLNTLGYDREREARERRERPGEIEAGLIEDDGRSSRPVSKEADEIEDIISKAKADGTYMLAPNGKPTNLNEEQWAMVRTKAFKNWFGDWENNPENASKVVDENGEPKVMYHGTNLTENNGSVAFWKFRPDSHFGTEGQADSRLLVDTWLPALAESLSNKPRTLKRIKKYEVFLNIRNPKRVKDTPQEWIDENEGTFSEWWDKQNDRAKYQGYDGIVYLNEYEDREHPADSWITFKPNQVKSATDNNGDFSTDNDDIRYSMRTKSAPKKTGTGYKVFVLKDGKLYPPMVANPNGEGTPIGMWLDADAAPITGTSKTGRPQVKAGGKGTQGGSGQLAYRPGWHLGTIPYALQFNRKDESGEKTLFPNNFVWAEVEYANDVDYNDEAYRAGVNENGKYQHSLAGLKHVPTDGSYMYRTNPNPETDPWIISGAMKVKKILSREEVDELVRQAGREPQQIQDGDVLDKQTLDELNAEIRMNEAADEMGLLYRSMSDNTQDIYNEKVAKKSLRFAEAWQDSMIGLKAIQDAIAAETGNVATGAEDAYHFENRMHGRAKNMTEQYDWRFYRPMLKAFSDFCNKHNLTQEQGIEYLVAKSGLERNVFYAFRNAMKQKVAEDISAEREKIEKDYAKGRIAEATYKQMKKDLEEKERTGVDDEMQKVKELLVYKRALEDYQKGDIDFTEYLRRIEKVINANTNGYYEEAARDFSGLTETFAKAQYDAAQEVKKEAQRAIDPREKRTLWSEYDAMMRDAYKKARQVAEDAVFGAESDISDTNKLWNTINAATKETLKTSYENGLIDRKGYDKVRDMFEFYIPLRGWDENKAADVYTYMGKDNVFSPAVKKTWGRTSKAENPLAYIGNIAVSTILSGHRNMLKQHFLNYVMNNPTNLVSISESWYENIGTEENPMWILRTADTAGKSADEIAQIVNDFNEEMQQKQAAGLAMPVKGRLRLDVNATKGQKSEHVVEVQRAGHTYQLYINGDPKAAQALNGTNSKAVSRISDTYLGQQVTKLNRAMAMFFTSKNPAFVVSNLSRDLNMAGASVAINEGAEYNARFIANAARVLTPRLAAGDFSREGIKAVVGKGKGATGMMPKLMSKWKNGKLNESNETERYFKEFMDEGGETGFVNMLSVDSFKEKMKKEIKEMNGSTLFGNNVKETTVGKALRLLGETFEFYNRCAEDATRFIVYMTSRQMGKTLEESIADAKDVTLNFNRKGTGDKGNAEVRDLFIFVNPAIQALANMYRMSRQHPLKFGAVTAAFVAGGAMMAILNTWALNMFGDDDDKEAYWNLPPWVRKNNLVIWVPGTNDFITIPLAQEFRVFYGVGEMLASASLDHPVHNPGLEIASSVADLIPINPTGNGGNLMVDFAPTMIQPLMQVGENVDFTGKPIWKDNQGNKFAPAYTKAYVSTPAYMVKIAEALNFATGGNEGKQGVVEQYSPIWGNYINNPAVWNHLLQGYFGGMYNTIAKGFDVIATTAQGEMPKVYQTPIINRFINRPVERDNAGALGEEYYKLIEDRDRLKYELKTWRKKAVDGEEGAQEHVDEILESADWKQAEVIDHYDKIMKDLRAGEKAATNSIDKADIKESIAMYKQQMDEELHAISDGKDPIDAAAEQFGNTRSFAERNKLRMRIERLTMDSEGASKNRTKSSEDEVRKALQYVEDEARESREVNEKYLQLATPQNIRDDARIKAARARLRVISDEAKRLQREGKVEESIKYQGQHSREINTLQAINSLSRTMNENKKLLGKGYDAQMMKLIDSNRRAIMAQIEKLEKP